MVALFVILTIVVCIGVDGVIQWRKAKKEGLARTWADELVPAEIEQQHIKRVLEEAGWNIYRASRLLGIDRVTLYNKIKKYGFKRELAVS